MPVKGDVKRNGVEPARWDFRSIQVHFPALSEIVPIALFFESCTPADGELGFHECLQRYDDLLPMKRPMAAPIDARCRLVQPAGFHILAAQGGRVTTVFQPCSIDYRTVRKRLKLV